MPLHSLLSADPAIPGVPLPGIGASSSVSSFPSVSPTTPAPLTVPDASAERIDTATPRLASNRPATSELESDEVKRRKHTEQSAAADTDMTRNFPGVLFKQVSPVGNRKQCPECFGYFVDLDTHRQSHLDDKKRSYICKVCERGFARPNDLARHNRVHQDSASFVCPFRAKDPTCHLTGEFSRVDTYKNHLRAWHFKYPPSTRRKDRQNCWGRCAGCGEYFNNPDIWITVHIDMHNCPALNSQNHATNTSMTAPQAPGSISMSGSAPTPIPTGNMPIAAPAAINVSGSVSSAVPAPVTTMIPGLNHSPAGGASTYPAVSANAARDKDLSSSSASALTHQNTSL
ncbi:hypothetical protein CANCADRAFT_56719 [Tortispora caseinolytica NRRL Y-17796]|uniref:C2H2-type domain-containing protein n=1 Tax=Tortispora caseinolytica NRRL Y-17796 TaxID=767744 RepID=A0A1E4TEK9_9ASCO|nr:hypothetical protein CANCADRAFT_56719 [Tortispora caseinolytica NRRL Y-17796]